MAKRGSRIFRVSIICVLMLMLSGMDALAASISVKINTSNTKIYKTASTSSKYIKAKKNLKVTLKAYGNGWGKVTRSGYTGYVKLKYLDRVSPLKAYTSSSTPAYKSASTSKKLGTISKGTTVYVISFNGSYARVGNKSGSVQCYVRLNKLTTKKPSSSSSSSSSGTSSSLKSTTSKNGSSNKTKIEYTIYIAQNLLGKPYSTSPNAPKSFDCARYTRYCYTKAKSGCVKYSAEAQGYDTGKSKISYSSLKRGDMVCFNTVSGDGDLSDHVGIYVGSGYFIHASSSAGKVIVSSMKSGYYKRNFSWGRRIFG